MLFSSNEELRRAIYGKKNLKLNNSAELLAHTLHLFCI